MVFILKSWVLIAVIAYFFHAATSIIDKFLLEKRISRPSTYAFWVGIFGIFALLLTPFGFFTPALKELLLAIFSGFLSVLAFYSFFVILQKSEASRIAPVIGGFSPIFVLLLSRIFLGESLEWMEFAAFLFLIAGGVLISFAIRVDGIHPVKSQTPEASADPQAGRTSNGVHIQKPETQKIFFVTMLSAFLFALTYVLFKAATNHTPFINAFIWSRLGGFAAAFLFLFTKASRSDILNSPRLQALTSTGALFMLNKFLGAAGFFLLDYAISIGRVSIINAMQGVEYTFIFIFAVILSRKYPNILREDFGRLAFYQKSIGIALVVLGLALLALG